MTRMQRKARIIVIPAKDGIHFDFRVKGKMDFGFRRDDGVAGLRRNDEVEGTIR